MSLTSHIVLLGLSNMFVSKDPAYDFKEGVIQTLPRVKVVKGSTVLRRSDALCLLVNG